MSTATLEEFNQSGLKKIQKKKAVTERCERKQSS